jgi:hypothetical protein
MPTDQIGNMLANGDAVAVKIGDQMMVAKIIDVREPSVLAPGKDQLQIPGQLNIMIPYTILYDVRNPRCNNVVKIVKPPNFNSKES